MESPTSPNSDCSLSLKQVSGRRTSICDLPFFGGCTACVLHEDEVIRPIPQFERGDEAWDPSELFCATDRKCGSKPIEEYVEEVEETTSVGEGEDTLSDTVESNRGQVPPGWVCRKGAPSPLDQDSPLLRELYSFMWIIGELFALKGWSVEHVGGDRFRLNGRCVKLQLLPEGYPHPDIRHLEGTLGFEVAARGSFFSVCDGPLRQPLMDYLLHTGRNESYDERGTENIAIVEGPGKYLDFHIAPTDDRILEMRNAMYQADLRRSASASSRRISALQSEGVKLLGSKGLGPPKWA
mmetsp:Transcript_29425/g.63803  ORF Transcript_29425/g.63803 Transcript_29425/m.63803 type:complete len:295 (-) Transcript_29425:324-1208(-)